MPCRRSPPRSRRWRTARSSSARRSSPLAPSSSPRSGGSDRDPRPPGRPGRRHRGDGQVLAEGQSRVLARRRAYDDVIAQICEIVRAVVPPGAPVLVVSKGDPGSWSWSGGPGWHFPQTPDGVYAGHYPADSAEAIGHLEDLRVQGGQFLLFPSTAFWWLEHYAALSGTSTVALPAPLGRRPLPPLRPRRPGGNGTSVRWPKSVRRWLQQRLGHDSRRVRGPRGGSRTPERGEHQWRLPSSAARSRTSI